jgi:gliding motility-associated-like protein
MHTDLNIIRLWILAAALTVHQTAWPQYLRNGTLEGPLGDQYPPDYWYTDDEYSDPDLLSGYTTYSGSRTYYPVNGSNFALLRARGVHYNESHHGPRQREYLYQPLEKSLEKNSCFRFSAWLCTNPDYQVEDTEDPNVGFPLRFQLWGSDHPGGRDTLLVDSDPISNTDWQNHIFYFTTSGASISYLLFEPQWDTAHVKPEPYNGMILVDLLNLDLMGPVDTLHEYTLYFHGDNQDTLAAPYGQSYQWSPAGYLSAPDRQSVVIRSYTETVSVYVTPENDCPFHDVYHLILDCDTLYPRDTNRIVNHYYKYETNIVLEASEGISYDWEPRINLSAYDIRAPYMTDYYDHYTVFITSKYNCPFKEYFNIILSCDTLYPEKNILVLDTLMEAGSSVMLTPRYGVPNDNWQPQKYLSCVDCQTPVAMPQSTITYSVNLTDMYGCTHTEIFVVGIELKIPNTITPNDDGFNDCLKIFGLPEGSCLRVYNKEGMLVYIKKPYNPDDCWNGTDQQDRPLRADTYWYSIDHPVLGIISTGYIFIKR